MSDWVVCSLVGKDPPYPGSTATKCEKCGRDVWVSPASRKMIVSGARTICVTCALAQTNEDTEFGITPEHANEIRAWLQRN